MSATADKAFPLHGQEQVFTYRYGNAVVCILADFDDYQGADLTIKIINLQPDSARGRGLGSKALEQFFDWARSIGLKTVRAVQVQSPSFFLRHGFVKDPGYNPCNNYSRTL